MGGVVSSVAGPILGGIGGLLGGAGVGSAARKVARTTDHLAESIAIEMRETRRLFEETVIPVLERTAGRLNETLDHLDLVFDDARVTLSHINSLVDVATHSLNVHTKTIGIVIMLIGALCCRRLIIDIKRRSSPIEELLLYVIYYFCIFLVFFFGYELLIEVGLLHNEGDYRIVIVFFSTAMFEMISKAFWYIVEHVTKLAYAIAHCFTVVCDYLFVCVVCNSCKQGSKILQYMWPGIYCLCYSSLCILYRFNHGALPFFCRSR